MIQIQLLFFGMLADLVGQPASQYELEAPITVGELRAQLLLRYPSLRERTFQIALNQDLVADDTALVHGAEVALLPPFAGG